MLRRAVTLTVVATAGALAAVAVLALLEDRRGTPLPAGADPVDESRGSTEPMESAERQDPPSNGSRHGGLLRDHAVPVIVAILVVLLLAGAMDFVNGRAEKKDEEPAASKASATKTAAQTGTPRFVVGVRRSGDALVVRDAQTGSQVGAGIAAPAGQRFHQIASYGEGAFVVSAYMPGRVTFHRLTLTRGGLPQSLTPLPGLVVQGTSTSRSDMAVSPDGQRIAYVAYGRGVSRIEIVSANGADRRRWTTRSNGRITNLSWTGGTLSFVWSTGGGPTVRRQVRTLDTTAPSGDLRTSRPVLPLPAGATTAALVQGNTVVAGVQQGTKLSLQEFSLQTRQPTRVWWSAEAGRPPVALVRASKSGDVLMLGAGGLSYGAPGQSVRTFPVEEYGDVAW
ncbi:TolB-like translocation protein [Thermomonospora amylolytica]|uniref:hypothetical protein n=1 Tax=Thermomonospora amylolytica TaxID=1411117 RepID=UPI000E6CEC2E|nr:hypothetical protein [Thermomonospora amylolytica]